MAEHTSSSDRAEAAASTRLAAVQQQQAVEVAMLRSTLSLLESSLQNSSKEKEAAQAEQELAHRHQQDASVIEILFKLNPVNITET